MRKLILAFVLSFLSVTALADVAAPAASTPPDQVIQQTAKDVFDSVNAKKAELQKDPNQLYDLIGKILLPRFDFARFDGMQQDELGVWNAPGGTHVAWFKDPDGNVLSLTQFA